MPATDTQNDIMLSKFSRKDGLILVCGVITFFILTQIGESPFGSSVQLGIIVACSCWIVSSRERYDATQQLNKVIDRTHRENEYLKSHISEQDKMLLQHQSKQLESENKLREEKYLSNQKCDEVENKMEKIITRSNKEIENVKTALFQHELENQMYKDRCISLTEHLRTAMTEGYSIETQLQTARIDIQQEREACEQYKKSLKKRFDTMKTQLQTARIDFQKEREEYEEYKKSSKETFDTMETQLQTNRIAMQKEHEAYEEYKKSSKEKFDTMKTQLQTARINFQKERDAYEEYKKSSKETFDTMETQLQTNRIAMQKEHEAYEEYKKVIKEKFDTMKTQLQTARIDFQKERDSYEEYKKSSKETFDTMETKLQINRIDMQEEREAHEEYKMSSKKRFYTMEIENNKYKELLWKHREIANKHKDSDRILQTSLVELEKMKNENNSLKLENRNLNKRGIDLNKESVLPKCSICMERERNTYIDPCGHTFCMILRFSNIYYCRISYDIGLNVTLGIAY
ncbi:unnamed protein product [Mytilus coruscus]|uniref:Uncharacterized protein n=1 Tax=Mytilus coruscus TaxID=42192 RepID=A0A6J8AJB3_MYTCO|nr:unnamed protein product [Mytilus coruscus]